MIDEMEAEMGLAPLELEHQPLGVFGLPAGMLLLPDSQYGLEVSGLLRAGRRPEVFPDDMRFYELALAESDPSDIIAALPPEGLLRDFNELALNPSRTSYESLIKRTSGDLALLVDWQGYLNGYCELPDFKLAEAATVAATLASSRASYLIEIQDELGAATLLRTAIALAVCASPVLAAGLRADLAQLLLRDQATHHEAIEHLRLSLAALGDAQVPELVAEVHLNLAIALHDHASADPRSLREAVQHYMEATRLVSAQSSPFVFGTAHMNLALAYLSMPMTEASDQLRYGIAIASLRHAVAAFDPTVFPEGWASARLNLANALVYAPSARQGDNLVEAVEIYEELLELRNRNLDPIGYARVAANQGNVLAHLGMFDHAKAKLHDARAIFEEFSMYFEISAIREVLDHIERERVGRGSSE